MKFAETHDAYGTAQIDDVIVIEDNADVIDRFD